MKVVLDPGHGGPSQPPKVGGSSWNNAIGPTGLLEKTVTLDVALFAQTHLTALGVQCTLTRQTDVNLGLSERAAVAERIAADAFVSIHFNASDAHNAQGTETFAHTRASAESSSLAASVQAAMVRATGYRDRGVKIASFDVINPAYHHAGTAVCLVEVSFMDVAAEEAKLKTAEYKDRIALALAQAIHGWLSANGALGIAVKAAAEPDDFPEDGYELRQSER